MIAQMNCKNFQKIKHVQEDFEKKNQNKLFKMPIFYIADHVSHTKKYTSGVQKGTQKQQHQSTSNDGKWNPS